MVRRSASNMLHFQRRPSDDGRSDASAADQMISRRHRLSPSDSRPVAICRLGESPIVPQSSCNSRGSSCCAWHRVTVSCHFLLIVALFATTCCEIVVGSASETDRPPVRYPDKLFSEATQLFGRLVTCSSNSTDIGYVFPSETWSCYDIRVSNQSLRSCYSHVPGSDSKCENEDGENDFGAICRHLLKLHNVTGDLKAALIVPDLQASNANPDGDRRRLVLTPTGNSFEWREFRSESGQVKNLRCMLDK